MGHRGGNQLAELRWGTELVRPQCKGTRSRLISRAEERCQLYQGRLSRALPRDQQPHRRIVRKHSGQARDGVLDAFRPHQPAGVDDDAILGTQLKLVGQRDLTVQSLDRRCSIGGGSEGTRVDPRRDGMGLARHIHAVLGRPGDDLGRAWFGYGHHRGSGLQTFQSEGGKSSIMLDAEVELRPMHGHHVGSGRGQRLLDNVRRHHRVVRKHEVGRPSREYGPQG